MRTTWMAGLALALSLALAGCDAEKKAAEAKALAEKQAAETKAAAEKQAADAKAAAEKAAAEAAEKAKAAIAAPKTELLKKLAEGVEAMDRKVDFLKQKAAKLPAPLKLKADAALATFDAAKSTVMGLKAQIEGAGDQAALTDVTTRTTSALGDAQKALDAAEAVIMKK